MPPRVEQTYFEIVRGAIVTGNASKAFFGPPRRHLVVLQDALVQECVPKFRLPLIARVAAYEGGAVYEEKVAGHVLAL